eukprot:CAMPEP_0115506544 /NCGR_PEP_ID=MMETSP0271-20121206/71218_1 /TAXON_ID=71861 /ORGANISM="Scrippsiella trochoidea, Strain CCMP3099" /LENGTH=282 /DNA_ID=CAMNT_0002936013 /DNA_START=456 /DNA_END=1302 /DNA_ORIENTATION=+
MKAKPNKVQAARRREKGFKTSSVAILCIDCWQFSLVSALSIKADTRFCVVFRVLLVLLLSTSCNSRHESLTMLTPCALALLEESLSKTFLGCPGKNSQSSVQQSRTTYASRAVKAFATKSNQRMATLCFDFSVLMLRGVPLGDAAFGSSPELCTLFELCMLLGSAIASARVASSICAVAYRRLKASCHCIRSWAAAARLARAPHEKRQRPPQSSAHSWGSAIASARVASSICAVAYRRLKASCHCIPSWAAAARLARAPHEKRQRPPQSSAHSWGSAIASAR